MEKQEIFKVGENHYSDHDNALLKSVLSQKVLTPIHFEIDVDFDVEIDYMEELIEVTFTTGDKFTFFIEWVFETEHASSDPDEQRVFKVRKPDIYLQIEKYKACKSIDELNLSNDLKNQIENSAEKIRVENY